MSTKQKLLLAAIVLLAVFFRFYLITQMPGGLFPDMAANGLDINLMQQGHIQPFYERGNGREALFFYMEWGSAALFGKGVWQFSVVSALMGVLAVIMCYLVTYRLMLIGHKGLLSGPGAKIGEAMVPKTLQQQFNEMHTETLSVFNPSDQEKSRAINIALLAAFLMAVSTWHIVLSRTAFRATLIPFFAALTIYFLLRSYQASVNSKRIWFSFLTGAAFALGFYTYIAFRVMAPVLFMLVAWPLLAQLKDKVFWRTLNGYKLSIISFIAAFIIFFLPLGYYFYSHPGTFLGRSGQVSIFNPELYTVDGAQLHGKPPLTTVLNVLAEVTKVSLLGFFTQGDLNWRHNISGAPFLSQIISPFFGIGLLLITLMGIAYFFLPNKKSHWWKFYLLTGWFWGMLLPVVTTAEAIPHGLRSVGLIPPVFIISAWALYSLAEWAYKAHQRFWHRCENCHEQHFQTWGRGLRMAVINFGLKLVVVCFFVALVFQTYILYFVYAYNSPENFYYFRSDLTPVSEYLINHCNKDHTYLVLDKFSVQTTDYLTSSPQGNFNDKCNVPYRQVDPENSWQLSSLQKGDEIVFTQSSIFDIKKFKAYHPNAELKLEHRNKFGQAVLAVYVLR